MVNHAHVPGVHNVGALFILIDGKVLPRTLLLHQGILVPAGLGAGPPVGVPPRHVVGQQAPARVGHAHGAMGKGLDLQGRRGLGPDFRDLLQGQLPGQDHPVGPQIVPGPGRLIAHNAGLGADVNLNRRGIPLGQGQHPHISQDHGGDAAVLQPRQPLGQPVHLLVSGHGVAGHVEGHPPAAAQVRRPAELLRGKVSREGAHAEGVPRQIDCVRPIGHGHLQPLPVPRGGQQFQLSLHGHQLFRKAWCSLYEVKKWWTPSSPRA